MSRNLHLLVGYLVAKPKSVTLMSSFSSSRTFSHFKSLSNEEFFLLKEGVRAIIGADSQGAFLIPFSGAGKIFVANDVYIHIGHVEKYALATVKVESTSFGMLAQCSVNLSAPSGTFEYVIFKN